MNRLETELQHMLNLISPPFFLGWRAFVWDKAKRLANQEPEEFADLPKRLEQAVLALRQNSSSSETPAEKPQTESPGKKAAPIPTTALRASTGQQSSCLLEGN